MGQRTQMVVKVTHVQSYSKIVKVLYGVYHNQWGIGKSQIKDAIRMITYYNDDYGAWTLPQKASKGWLTSKWEWCTDLTPEGVRKYLNETDNNDGGIFLNLVVIDSEVCGGKMYIYSDPEAEKHRTDRVEGPISLSTYIRSNPRYYDKDFYNMLKAVCKYHNIEIIKGRVQC